MGTIRWVDEFGPVRLGVLPPRNGHQPIRLRDTTTGQTIDLHGCERDLLLAAFCDMAVIEACQFFAVGREIVQRGCVCRKDGCPASSSGLLVRANS